MPFLRGMAFGAATIVSVILGLCIIAEATAFVNGTERRMRSGPPPAAAIDLAGPASTMLLETRRETRADAKADLRAAVRYLWRSPTARGILWELAHSHMDVRLIVDDCGIDSFDTPNELRWDPRAANVFGDPKTERQSPALILVHEAIHALHYDEHPIGARIMNRMRNEQYGDFEEARTIATERIVAQELGVRKRFNHVGMFLRVNRPESTIPSRPLRIWPQDNRSLAKQARCAA